MFSEQQGLLEGEKHLEKREDMPTNYPTMLIFPTRINEEHKEWMELQFESCKLCGSTGVILLWTECVLLLEKLREASGESGSPDCCVGPFIGHLPLYPSPNSPGVLRTTWPRVQGPLILSEAILFLPGSAS